MRTEIHLQAIVDNPWQPRMEIEEEGLGVPFAFSVWCDYVQIVHTSDANGTMDSIKVAWGGRRPPGSMRTDLKIS